MCFHCMNTSFKKCKGTERMYILAPSLLNELKVLTDER